MEGLLSVHFDHSHVVLKFLTSREKGNYPLSFIHVLKEVQDLGLHFTPGVFGKEFHIISHEPSRQSITPMLDVYKYIKSNDITRIMILKSKYLELKTLHKDDRDI